MHSTLKVHFRARAARIAQWLGHMTQMQMVAGLIPACVHLGGGALSEMSVFSYGIRSFLGAREVHLRCKVHVQK